MKTTSLFRLAAMMLLTAGFSLTTRAQVPLVITNNTFISATDTNLEGRVVTVNSNVILTVAGQHQLASLTIYGLVTHGQGDTNGVNLIVDGAVNVAAGGRIDVSALGYLGGNKPGNAFNPTGQTRGAGGVPAAGSTPNGGGSHGSLGGGNANPLYGSEVAPVDLGSGGGGGGGNAMSGNGGGRMHLRAQSLVVDGKLLANGERSFDIVSLEDAGNGGGSGGSILVELAGGSFSGSGVIEAKGGVGNNPAFAGGGGRIAIVGYTVNSFAGTLGRAATIFTQVAATGGHLQLDVTSLTIAVNTTNTYGSLGATTNGTSYLYNYGTLAMSDDTLVVGPGVSLMQNGVVKGANRPDNWIGSVTVQTNGVLWHSTGNTNGVQLNVAGTLTVAPGGRIDVSALGYLGGNKPGNAFNPTGQTRGAGGVPAAGSTPNGGGSHGSLGGGNTNPLYGSEVAPVDLGSGGGGGGGNAMSGNGGGRMHLRAQSLVVDGKLLANGERSFDIVSLEDAGNGGGSGGSILVELAGGSFSGSGVIEAKGGVGNNPAFAGGGGRIAIVGYTANSFAGTLGRAATIFTQVAGTGGHLQLDVTSLTIAVNTTNTYGSLGATTNGTSYLYNYGTLAMSDDTLVVGPGVSLMQNGVVKGANRPDNWIGSVTVQTNGVLWHSTGNTNGVQLNVAGTLTVAPGGRIDVSALGYLGGNKPGNAFNPTGQTRGAGGVPAAGSTPNGGGSHGSLGGGNTNPLYGSEVAPVDLGSGGGGGGGNGMAGNGGGRMHLRAQSLVVDGKLLANGERSFDIVSLEDAGNGGGSGGSILVELAGGSFSGSGVIEAKGGVGNNPAFAGGGGRIAIVGYTANSFAGTLGRAATIFTQVAGTGGHLQLDVTSLTIAVNTTNTYGSLGATTNGTSYLYNYGTLAMSDDTLVVGPGVSLMQNGVVKGANRPDNRIGSVTVQTNGVLWHSTGNTNGVQLNVAGTLTVAPGGRIDVSALGYLGGNKPGNAFSLTGQTRGTGGVPATGSPPTAGGSHGSLGGGPNANPLYGSEVAPVDLGSGGGGGGGNGMAGNGGGRMHLRAQSLVVDGKLLANGERSFDIVSLEDAGHGGGSGGSILVELAGGSFSGSGVIEAKGGVGNNPAVAGGGGRIAIVGCFTRNFSGVLTNTGTLYMNACPVLPVQSDRAPDELTLLTVTNTASDDDLTNVLTYALLSAPGNATISANGVIQWLTSESDGPSTNVFTTVVSDNAKAPLLTTNSFTVVVNEINLPPSLTPPPNANVNERVTYTGTATATDPDIPINPLTFALASGPAGLTVSPSGEINWTPDEAQGPGTYPVTLRVTDTNPPAVNATSLSVTSSFSITVNEVNLAPVLGALTDYTVNPGQTISFTATATDADRPTNTLSYSLISPPPGANINTANGAFNWRPSATLASTTNVLQVRVQDNGAPVSNDVKSFTVIVNAIAPLQLTPIRYFEGQFQLQINGPTDPDYVIMASTNLTVWTDIATNLSPATPFQFTDPAAGTFNNRFYRVRLKP